MVDIFQDIFKKMSTQEKNAQTIAVFVGHLEKYFKLRREQDVLGTVIKRMMTADPRLKEVEKMVLGNLLKANVPLPPVTPTRKEKTFEASGSSSSGKELAAEARRLLGPGGPYEEEQPPKRRKEEGREGEEEGISFNYRGMPSGNIPQTNDPAGLLSEKKTKSAKAREKKKKKEAKKAEEAAKGIQSMDLKESAQPSHPGNEEKKEQ